MSNFPTHPDQLSTEWLSSALGRPISNFSVEYLGEGAGLLAWVMRLSLVLADGGSETVMAKFPSPSAENRAVASGFDMYQREVGFYRDVAPHVSIRAPRCLHADIEPVSGDFVLLLEDIGHLRIGDQVEGCSLEEARAVLRALAGLHASSWRALDLPELVSQNNDKQIQGMIGGFEAGWPVVSSRFEDVIPKRAREVGERMPGAVARLLATMCVEPVCLSHADVRLDNIFFDDAAAGGIEVALVDWQSICTSAPEQDVAYFLTQSVPRDVLAKQDLLAYYHAELVGHGVDYDLATCRERFRVSALYLLCYAVTIAGTLDLRNERGAQLGRTLLGNSLAALDQLDAFELL
jgi:aminoglycoside/choline kinase family phosphotransferase